MANIMKDIASALDVEFGGEFEVFDKDGIPWDCKFRLTENGLEYQDLDGQWVDSIYLNEIANGTFKILPASIRHSNRSGEDDKG